MDHEQQFSSRMAVRARTSKHRRLGQRLRRLEQKRTGLSNPAVYSSENFGFIVEPENQAAL
jgi:hypothetical protein